MVRDHDLGRYGSKSLAREGQCDLRKNWIRQNITDGVFMLY
jgi:hypothetical protein